MDKTDFSDATMNLIAGNFPEHEEEEDVSPCVLWKTALITTLLENRLQPVRNSLKP